MFDFSILVVIDISVAFLIIELTVQVRKPMWDFTSCHKCLFQLYFQELIMSV